MHSPPSDMSVNILWKEPVVPKHNYREAAEVRCCGETLCFLWCCYKTGLDWDPLGKEERREHAEF